MNMNYGVGCYQQSVKFNGRVDKKSIKLAKQIGGGLCEALEQKAETLGKNTVLALRDSGKNGVSEVYAYSTKLGNQVNLVQANNANLTSVVKKIEPKNVEGKIVDEAIRHIQSDASAEVLSNAEKRMLKAEAKEVLNVQRQFGINKPFWSETKQLMVDAKQRYYKNLLDFDRQYQEMKQASLSKRYL